MSSHFTCTSTVVSTTTPTRIALVDNTAPPPAPPSADQSSRSLSLDGSPNQSGNSLSDGKRETLRRAIAERRYKRWPVNPSSADATDTEDNLEEAPDARAEGVVVVESNFGDSAEGKANNRRVGADGAGDGGAENSQRRRQRGEASDGVGGTGQTPQRKGGEAGIAEIDVLYENQRGSFICGIPLFSSNSLLNFDPSAWQNGHFHNSAVSILDAQVPDPSWVWYWKSWYVDMTADVDEEGWAYSFSFSPAFAWHGNHVWFHSFVRRRRWLRKRVKLPARSRSRAGGPVGDFVSSRASSVERTGHGLNNDYFTIHSRKERSCWHAGGSHKRRSMLEGSDWGGDDDSDEEVEIKDIPSLMRIVKKARLDREKIEAIMRFVEDGGEELAFLAEKMSTLMSWMMFRASRRQLLAHLIGYSEQYEAGQVPSITILLASSPPVEPASSQHSTIKSGLSHENPQSFTRPKPGILEGKHPSEDDPEIRSRKVENLKRAVHAADQEVKKMEFWSDVKDIAREVESVTTMEGWDHLGISGTSIGNENVFGDAGHEGGPEIRERVDIKGKGKAV